MSATIFLLALVLLTYLWYTNTHIKEQAFELAHTAVEKKGYQLLDDAIGLSGWHIIRHGWRFSLMRIFEFQYADENNQRHVGQVIRCGNGWLNIEFSSTSKQFNQNNERKVIPFPGTYTHD